MKVSVDRSLCTGHAQCAIVCPAVFDVDDEGFAVVLSGGEVPVDEEERAELAIAACPEQAISEVEE